MAVFAAHSEFLRALPHAQVLQYGRVGVDLFFVLSGFLITGILIDSKSSEHYFRNFYMRRALRIWPLYYALLLLFFLATPSLAANVAGNPGHVWPYFASYLQNLFPHLNMPNGLGPTWSLAIEEQFYMTWPLLVFLCPKRTLSAFLAGLISLSVALRIIGYLHGASFGFIHQFTLCRMDAIAFGSLAAIWLRSPGCTSERWRRLAAQCVVVGVIGLILARVILHAQSSIVGYTFLAMSFAGLLGLALVSDVKKSVLGRILTTPWIRFTGKISYGLYLLHMPMFLLWNTVAQHQNILMSYPILRNLSSALVQFALALLVATISWRIFESRMLRLKSFFPSGRELISRFNAVDAIPVREWDGTDDCRGCRFLASCKVGSFAA